MAYDLMNTKNLKKELLRRIADIDEWANKSNIEKAHQDLCDELNKSDEWVKASEEKLNKVLKRCKFFKCLTIIGFFSCIFSIVISLILKLYFNNLEMYKYGCVLFVVSSILTLFLSCFTKPNISLKNDHYERADVLYWYYSLLYETYIKQIYKKVYFDTFKVVDKLCEDKKIKNKVEDIKKEIGVDFSYLDEYISNE
jgi:hypothetical protein